MSIEMARAALLWCAVMNAAILMVWGLLLVLPHGWMHRLHARWLGLSASQFDSINFAGLVVYKAGVLLFNVVPCVALYLVV
jgi:hypothetical protein